MQETIYKKRRISISLFGRGGIQDIVKCHVPANIPLYNDVLIKTNIYTLVIRLHKTSSRRLDQDDYIFVFFISPEDVFKTFSRHLQDVFKMSCQDVFKTSLRCLQNVLQKRLQDIFNTSCQDVSKTSCKDAFKTSSRRFQGVFKTSSWHFQGVFKTSSWRLQDVSSSQTVLVNASSRRLQDVFETYCEDRKIGLGHTSEKFMVRKQIFQGRILWISWNF